MVTTCIKDCKSEYSINRDSNRGIVGYFCNVRSSEQIYRNCLENYVAQKPMYSTGYKPVISQYTRGLS